MQLWSEVFCFKVSRDTPVSVADFFVLFREHCTRSVPALADALNASKLAHVYSRVIILIIHLEQMCRGHRSL